MKLYDIEEPKEENQGLAVGIDLGTTNSLVAFHGDKKVEIISDLTTKSKLLPSVIGYQKGEFILGAEAKDIKNHISSIKRLMGLNKYDLSKIENIDHFNLSDKSDGKMLYVKIEEHEFNPIELSAEILKKLKSIAESRLKKEVNRAVITVPAYFDDAARNATKQAADLAGIEVLRLINEPTSAAIAYQLDKKSSGIFLVYDLGGGTFDVSILKMQKGIMQVIATSGNTMLGGDDFDYALMNTICQKHFVKINQDSLTEALLEVRTIKESLSSSNKWSGYINFIGKEYTISREDFESAIMEDVLKTVKLVKKTLKESSFRNEDIDEIILVGGATKIPLIGQILEKKFDKKPLSEINPEEVVAAGAAIQAKALTEGSDNLLLDITPLSLGIELIGQIVEVIIPKNAPIPTLISKTYTTYQDNQTGIKIHILQGESEEVSRCRSLGRIELSNLPKMPAGKVKVIISFKLDADGILTVTAEESSTGKAKEIMLKPSYDLD